MGVIRFLLAVSVVFAHANSRFSLVGGQVAVQAFYIISGFYMSLILNEKYIGANGSYKLFITNRFLRLYPVYWSVLLLTIIFAVVVYFFNVGSGPNALGSFIAYFGTMKISSIAFLIFTNVFLFFQDMVMFLGLDTSNGSLFFTSNFRETNPQLYNFHFIPQAWTIGVELTFYLIAPFLVRSKLKFIILFILLSISLRFILYHYGLRHDPWSYRFFPTELVFFILGNVSYKMYVKFKQKDFSLLVGKLALVAIIGFTMVYNQFSIPFKYYGYMSLFFCSLPFIFILTKKWKMDSYIGELSYPIYISHIFVFTCLEVFNVIHIGDEGLILSIATIALSILLNEVIAKRIEKIRKKRIIVTAGNTTP